jgi:Xaa-Pro aminopeptidase
MKKSIYMKRMAELREIMGSTSADTAWIIQPENRRYLSGFKAGDPQLNESSGSLLINDNSCLLVTDSRYTLEAEREAVDFEVQTANNGLLESFPELLERLKTNTLGFEEDHLTYGLHDKLSKKFKNLSNPIHLSALNGIVEKMREVKDDQELKSLKTSAELLSNILDEVVDGLKPGITEKKVAWQIEGLAKEAGAEDLAFPSIVASGPNSALPHAVPTDRKIRVEEPIIFDMGIKVDGYCSDMTRTVFLGEASEDLRKIYSTVRKAQLAALKEIRPGVKSNNPDSVARTVIGEAGFGKYFGHALGHGVGLATHEQPRLSPRNPVELEKGMVVTVEPGIYVPGKGGVRLEEMVVIEAEGPKILTNNKILYDFS